MPRRPPQKQTLQPPLRPTDPSFFLSLCSARMRFGSCGRFVSHAPLQPHHPSSFSFTSSLTRLYDPFPRFHSSTLPFPLLCGREYVNRGISPQSKRGVLYTYAAICRICIRATHHTKKIILLIISCLQNLSTHFHTWHGICNQKKREITSRDREQRITNVTTN